MQHKIQYLTAKLQEEAAEVIQAVSKINRFGPQNSHPDRTTTNLQELVGELEDFLAIVAALEHYRYIDLTPSLRNIDNKAQALVQG
jgi:NTP pyrophosphatase (non-canonical NTP hydrolase)